MKDQVIEPRDVASANVPVLTLATLSQVCGRVVIAISVSSAAEILLCQSEYGFLGWAILCFVLQAIGVGCARLRGENQKTSVWWRVGLASLFVLGVTRLVWQGSNLAVFGLLMLIIATALNELGIRPTALPMLRTLQLVLLTLGKQFLQLQSESVHQSSRSPSMRWHQENAWSYLIPAAVAGTFVFVFVLANQEAVSWFGDRAIQFGEWLLNLGPFQFMTWMFVAAFTLMLLSPWLKKHAQVVFKQRISAKSEVSQSHATAFNTLVVVIVVFTVYLVVEFISTLLRQFPEGFYYSGYAHQGAAWLVVALLLSTLVLSAIFSSALANDPRYRRLLVLANVWSLLNFLLSVAAMWRLIIYIDFNGLTIARIVGIAGILCVVCGFALLMWKINYKYTFIWLIDKQLVALSVFCFLLVVLPIDWMAHEYNVRQIENGNERPTVQLVCQDLSNEAMLAVFRLKDHPTPWIRNGVMGLLKSRAQQLEDAALLLQERQTVHWPRWQGR